jgi:hypothetical protein
MIHFGNDVVELDKITMQYTIPIFFIQETIVQYNYENIPAISPGSPDLHEYQRV